MPDAKCPLCLESALAFLYTSAHKATFRLLVDAVIARRHLRRVHESSWPSFVLTGQTKSGKSLLTIGACRLFGLDDGLLIRSVPSETERSMWGRRIQLQDQPRRGERAALGGMRLPEPPPLRAWSLLGALDVPREREGSRRATGDGARKGDGDGDAGERRTAETGRKLGWRGRKSLQNKETLAYMT